MAMCRVCRRIGVHEALWKTCSNFCSAPADASTARLHDRDKSAWWLAVFYLVPGVLGQLAKAAWSAGAAGTALHYILALAAFALTIWGFVEIGCLRGTAGSNTYGPNPLLQPKRRG